MHFKGVNFEIVGIIIIKIFTRNGFVAGFRTPCNSVKRDFELDNHSQMNYHEI